MRVENIVKTRCTLIMTLNTLNLKKPEDLKNYILGNKIVHLVLGKQN